MTEQDVVRVYLPNTMLEKAKAGGHRFLSHVHSVIQEAGLAVEYRHNSMTAQLAAPTQDRFSLFYMGPTNHEGALVFRKNYISPFWQIADVAERWSWPVAKKTYDPATIEPAKAQAFTAKIRDRLFPNVRVNKGSFIYVPLQGRLLQTRGFQSMSPLDMLETLAAHEPDRPIVATLHPGEQYSNLEREELGALVARHPRISLSHAAMSELLPSCSLVATENSSVALHGFLLEKPAVLFAKIDFHHVAANVGTSGVAEALEVAKTDRPDFDRYLFWFLQKHSINAARSNAHSKIKRRLRRYGWPV